MAGAKVTMADKMVADQADLVDKVVVDKVVDKVVVVDRADLVVGKVDLAAEEVDLVVQAADREDLEGAEGVTTDLAEAEVVMMDLEGAEVETMALAAEKVVEAEAEEAQLVAEWAPAVAEQAQLRAQPQKPFPGKPICSVP